MKESADELRKKFPCTVPSVLRKYPVFGLGYRPPWRIGNICQAKIAKKYNLNVMLAQQSAREIERTGRSFQDVVDSATLGAYEANLDIPWGADGDHLRNEKEVEEAAKAGCTHFTYDVSSGLEKGLDSIVMRISDLYLATKKIKKELDFTTEISLDETDTTTSTDDIIYIISELKKRKIKINEIAPRFPGVFEKGIDYYLSKEGNNKIQDTDEFEKYLSKISKVAIEYNFIICVHSGSDKFLIYPILAKILKNRFHLKTAGTYYLEELKIIARHDIELFRNIYEFSFTQFKKDRATYHLSTDINNIPALTNMRGKQISDLLNSGTGSDDLRQVLHVTYGSMLTVKNSKGRYVFADKMKEIINKNKQEYEDELENHIKRHIVDFLNL